MFLKSLLEHLADNSRYPKYQHERRIDIFISFFLRSILERVLNEEISRVIPEFPFKKDSSFATTNIDYFAYSSVAKTAYFVELRQIRCLSIMNR